MQICNSPLKSSALHAMMSRKHWQTGGSHPSFQSAADVNHRLASVV